MSKSGHIEIKVSGSKGNISLNPEQFDIREIRLLLENVESLLFPSEKRNRPTISYEIAEGSVRNIFRTSLQAVIAFNAILGQVQAEQSIDFLESPSAKAFESFQEFSRKQDYTFEFTTSISDKTQLIIDRNTHFFRTDDIWAEAAFYFYGTIIDMGGKTNPNIHLDTKELGVLIISADREMLASYEGNPLYKPFGIRAKGKQNVRSGEIEKSSLQLLKIISYKPSYDEDYLQNLIQKAKSSWSDVKDADEWLKQMRHG